MTKLQIPESYQEVYEEYESLTTEHLELVKKRILETFIDAGLKYDLVRRMLGERAVE